MRRAYRARCYQCGEPLPLDLSALDRHLNERHPLVLEPGAHGGLRARPVNVLRKLIGPAR